jgi:hypothetical protein
MPTVLDQSALDTLSYRVVSVDSLRVLCYATSSREAEGRAFIHALLRDGQRQFRVERRTEGGGWRPVSQTGAA